MKTKDQLIIEKLSDLKNELIAWLNDECPKTFPPLEPYTTADLSHDFADLLRIRLDEITITRGELAALKEAQPTELIVPSGEEIRIAGRKHSPTDDRWKGFDEGAKWAIEQIKRLNK